MKEKIRYTDEPMQVGRVLRDFLPSPDKLVLADESVKVTISLSVRSVQFFKAEAVKAGGQYQRMIRSVLDAYVAVFDPAGDGKRPPDRRPNRLEQTRATYRKAAKSKTKQ